MCTSAGRVSDRRIGRGVARTVRALIAAAGIVGIASCVGPFRFGGTGDPCAEARSTATQPFDSSSAATLAGRYRLYLVSDWEDEAGHVASARLTLLPTDTLHQRYEQVFTGRWRRHGNRVLWGWADLRSKGVSIPRSADPASRDPEHPGVLLHSNGRLELGVWRGFDGSSTTLGVRQISQRGFAGLWGSDLGIALLMRDGRVLENPHGHFCAVRES